MPYIKNNISKKIIINNILNENNAQAILIYNPKNRLWYSEFKSTEGYVLITKKESILYVDSRYITAAKQQAKNIDKIIQFGDIFKLIGEYLEEKKITKLSFESDFITYNNYELYKKVFDKKIKLIPINCSKIRTIKTNEEIALIHKACKISDKAFDNVLKTIKIGMSELDVDKVIFSTFMDEGADEFSFPTIVASGKRGAMPHGRASKKILAKNELVTIDFGCYYKGYSSDITRTIALGNVSSKLQEIYEIVRDAQDLGIKAIKPGISTKEIDTICRQYIEKKGYGEFFKHSTGHGLGADVHEFPRLSPYCDVKLEPGMVVTVEPGIYIPELGGVRIEDDVLVTDDGYKLLTKSLKKELIIK